MTSEFPRYVDDGALRVQDDVTPVEYLDIGDRAKLDGRGEPFFSGRETEVSSFLRTMVALSRGKRANATICVEGVPGAGKSALMAQCIAEMYAGPPTDNGKRNWLPVLLTGTEGEHPPRVAAAIDEAIAVRLAKQVLSDKTQISSAANQLHRFLGKDAIKKAEHDTKKIARNILDRGFSVASLFRLGGSNRQPTDTLRMIASERAGQWHNWQIVLMIDEAQTISSERPGAVEGTLSAIHEGRMPESVHISFCAFGLPGTLDALGNVGISRTTLNHDLLLAGLSSHEAEMCVRRCFSQFGIEKADRWAKTILERSANWPQHLSAYLHAALTVMLPNAVSESRIGDAEQSSLRKAIVLGDKTRSDYYDRRLRRLSRHDSLYNDYAVDLVQALKDSGGSAKEATLARHLMKANDLTSIEATAFLRKAQSQGLVSVGPHSLATMPIRSFAGHVLEDPLPPINPSEPTASSLGL